MDELTRYDLQWCARRLPRDLKDMMKREGPRVFVAGGFIRSCIANEPVNDIDVFTATREDAERLAWELANGKPMNMEGLTDPETIKAMRLLGHKVPYTTDNAFTVTTRRVSVQFIHRWSFTRPEDAIASFDFTIAKAALWWNTPCRDCGTRFHRDCSGNFTGWCSACEETFYADLAAKRLVYTSPVRNEDAGGSLLRVLKFYQRGYRIPLDSLGAVLARISQGVHGFATKRESALADDFTSLLREVDPVVDPDAEGHVDTVEGPTLWECYCGYRYEGAIKPSQCPNCGLNMHGENECPI